MGLIIKDIRLIILKNQQKKSSRLTPQFIKETLESVFSENKKALML